MATLYDMNYLRQIEANDSEFNKAQKADNLRNMQANIAINGLPEQQNAMQQPVISQPTPAPVEAAMSQTAQESDPSWYLKANTLPTKVTQAAAQGSTPSFSAQAVTNAAIANLMKKGYSQDEAAQMLSPYIMDWQYRERQENKAKADNIMQQMSNMQYGSQDYYNAALQMYQVDPERGQMLLRGAVAPKDMWVRQNHLDDIEDQRNWQIQAAGMGLLGGGGRRGRGGGSGGGGGRSGGGGGRGRAAAQYGGFTKTQYDMAGKMLTNLNKQISALQEAGKEVPASMKRKAMALDNIVTSYENGVLGFNVSGNNEGYGQSTSTEGRNTPNVDFEGAIGALYNQNDGALTDEQREFLAGRYGTTVDNVIAAENKQSRKNAETFSADGEYNGTDQSGKGILDQLGDWINSFQGKKGGILSDVADYHKEKMKNRQK